jgi:hypothetical protein
MVVLWQLWWPFGKQPKAQQNDEQTDFLENPIPHINVPIEFNQDTSKSGMNIAIAFRENNVSGNV